MTAADLNRPSGEVVVGNPDDVSLLQMEKFADFQVAKSVLDELTRQQVINLRKSARARLARRLRGPA